MKRHLAWLFCGALVALIVPALPQGDTAIKANGATVTVAGGAAHGSAVAGNPLLMGGEALSTERAAVTNGQGSRTALDLVGKLVTSPYAVSDDILSGTASTTGTGNTSLISAQAAGIRIYVTTVIVSNNSATNTEVVLKDGTTALATVPAPANFSGATVTLPVPLRGTAATAFQFASTVAATTITCSVVGFKGR